MIKMQVSTPIESEGNFVQSRDEFQKTLTLELFNLTVSNTTHPSRSILCLITSSRSEQSPASESMPRSTILPPDIISPSFGANSPRKCSWNFSKRTTSTKSKHHLQQHFRQEMSSFSLRNINETSIIQQNDLNKRNFYLQLFRTYCELPFEEISSNF